MKTLEQHNKERSAVYEKAFDNEPTKNGIVCPLCGDELWDSYPAMTLTSMPPKKCVHCPCGYRGYRIA